MIDEPILGPRAEAKEKGYTLRRVYGDQLSPAISWMGHVSCPLWSMMINVQNCRPCRYFGGLICYEKLNQSGNPVRKQWEVKCAHPLGEKYR